MIPDGKKSWQNQKIDFRRKFVENSQRVFDRKNWLSSEIRQKFRTDSWRQQKIDSCPDSVRNSRTNVLPMETKKLTSIGNPKFLTNSQRKQKKLYSSRICRNSRCCWWKYIYIYNFVRNTLEISNGFPAKQKNWFLSGIHNYKSSSLDNKLSRRLKLYLGHH